MQYLSPFPGHKKTQIFHQREEELRHALKHAEPPPRIARAVERLRFAKLQLIKALRAPLGPSAANDPKFAAHVAHLEQDAARWAEMPADEILRLYRQAGDHDS